MRKIWRVLIGTAMAAVLMAGCGSSQETAQETPMATEDTAAQQDENSVEATGTIDAQTVKQIYLEFPAAISNIYVTVGQEVKKGDKLVGIDYKDYMSSIEQKETELQLEKVTADGAGKSSAGDSQQINVLREKAATLSQNLASDKDPDINDLEDKITSLKSSLDKKQRELNLQKQLVEEGAGAEEDVKTLNEDIKDLNNQISSLQQQIISKKQQKNIELSDYHSQIATLQDTISDNAETSNTAAATYAIKQKISNLEVSQMADKYNKDYIKGNDIISNIPAGIIKTINVVEGSKVGQDGTSLMEIIDEGSLVIKANVPEEFIKDVKVGAEVNIIPYADREAAFKGKVKEIQQLAVNNNGEVDIPVIIEATEKSPYLNYGYTVDVEIHK